MTNPWTVTNLTGNDQQLRKVAGTYGGYSLRETSGMTTAQLTIYDSKTGANGKILEVVTVPAGETRNVEYKRGIQAQEGIFIDVVAGAVAGSVRTN